MVLEAEIDLLSWMGYRGDLNCECVRRVSGSV